jgi:hypothetical protein
MFWEYKGATKPRFYFIGQRRPFVFRQSSMVKPIRYSGAVEPLSYMYDIVLYLGGGGLLC